jgi:polyisoprenoid-binding protein YceI
MAKWNIDPDHSVAAFSVRHMMVSNVRGQFNKLSGTANLDLEDYSGFTMEVLIDVTGLYTGISQRDEHLSSPDFFDVAKHPNITFRSSGFEAESGSSGKLSGELTIHGITRPVSLDVTFSGPVKSPEDFGGETTLGITARASVNREDFGMAWNAPLEGGGVMVGKDIEIYLDIEADLEK